MRFFGVWPARRNIIGTSYDRSMDSHACSDSQCLPRPMTIARYKITQYLPERQRPMSLRSAQQLVSCFGRIYSHLEVLTQGISSGNRNVFTNTPSVEIVMYVYYYIMNTQRDVYMLNFAVTLCTLQLDAYTVLPFLFAPLVIGHPDYTATSSLQ